MCPRHSQAHKTLLRTDPKMTSAGASVDVYKGLEKRGIFSFRVSERQIVLYKATDLSAPVCTVGLDVSPAILQTYLDHDSGTLFLTGRVSYRTHIHLHPFLIFLLLIHIPQIYLLPTTLRRPSKTGI